MINLTKGFCAILICLIIFPNAYGQDIEDCEQNLKQAYSDYEAGQFNKCITLLESCASELNQSAYEAYRLLALCYMQLNEDEKADKAVRALLKSKPDYKTYPMFDNAEFNLLLSKYEVYSGIELGIRANINVNSIRVIQNHAINNTEASFNPEMGVQTGANMEYYLHQNLSVGVGLCYEILGYSRSAKDLLGWDQEFTEKLNYMSIPITANYYLKPKGAWGLGFEVGLQPQFLRQTNSTIILTKNDANPLQNTMSQLDQRNKTQVFGLAGISVKRKLGQGTIVSGVRLSYGFSNIVNPEKRYDNLSFIMDNQYVDSDIAFIPVYFMFGYQLSLSNMYKVERVKD